MTKPLFLFVKLILFTLLCFLNTIASSDNTTILRMATTTSTQNSGLLQAILPEFEKQSGYKVHIIAVGTGMALKMGHSGDVDLLMVHAPEAEKQFIDSGYGLKRYALMYNDFVLVGPGNDPAEILGTKTVAQAMTQIVKNKALFISRGDDSGTHKKEQKLWHRTIDANKNSWYREAGQGMGKVLQMADELNAYTLVDRGTWLSYEGKLRLQIVFSGDPALFNPYSLIAINPHKFTELNHKGAMALIQWLISPTGQKLIGAYQVRNVSLFKPSALEPQIAGARFMRQTR